MNKGFMMKRIRFTISELRRLLCFLRAQCLALDKILKICKKKKKAAPFALLKLDAITFLDGFYFFHSRSIFETKEHLPCQKHQQHQLAPAIQTHTGSIRP